MAKEARSSRLSALRKRRSFPLERPLIGPFRIRSSSFVLSSILREYEGFEIVHFFCYEQSGFEFEQGTPSTMQELRKFLAEVASLMPSAILLATDTAARRIWEVRP